MIEHRTAWLRRQRPSFGRKRKGGKGIDVGRVGKSRPGRRAVGYEVPTDKMASGPEDAVAKLQRFRAEISTGSDALELLEQGGVTRAKGKLLTIPVKTRGLPTPSDFKKKYPNRRLRIFPRRGGGYLVFEEMKKVVAQRVRDRKKIRKLRLRYAQLPRVMNRPTLKFYRTWDQLRGARDLKLRDRTRRMVEDMEAGRG
ncbi:MAG: hypothetical protein ACE37K_11205 [Planctomycetota bacterium]